MLLLQSTEKERWLKLRIFVVGQDNAADVQVQSIALAKKLKDQLGQKSMSKAEVN